VKTVMNNLLIRRATATFWSRAFLHRV